MWRILTAALFIGALVFSIYGLSRDLMPRTSLVFAAGVEGGGYWRVAEQYRDILAEDGIDVELIETAGSVGNARLLAQNAADVAFMQGGVDLATGTDALGTIFFEPVWLFTLTGSDIPTNPGAWRDIRIAAGGVGSGTRAAFDDLSRSAGFSQDTIEILPLGAQASADALLTGDVDLAFFVAPISAPYLTGLLESADVDLLVMDQLTALSRQLPESQIVTLPQGGFRMFPPLPQQDVRLLAMVARLDAQDRLHPTLVDRLVEAAIRIHGGADALTEGRRFPGVDTGPQPIDAYARDLIEDGPSPLREFLPYWVVAQISRFAILLVPFFILLLPVMRALPSLYSWRMRSRVYKYYAEIRKIDQAARNKKGEELALMDVRLREIDNELTGLKLPPSYRDYAYTARLHVQLQRGRIKERLARERGR